jgi:hypothetical protein
LPSPGRAASFFRGLFFWPDFKAPGLLGIWRLAHLRDAINIDDRWTRAAMLKIIPEALLA